ncbi:hypothetical protein AB0A74_26170 [Saccharothrix sp. NPDC042600]|uniref:hypothetical protein n=1 Tax=Saccharothrix TaxID=2071 RepID=UPI0033F067A6|nr:hypothetical protein GCM10017745_28540 [Saccharothrix mutabilis subsp. capreolus]
MTRTGADARTERERLRGRVDLLTEASYEGARFGTLSAFPVATSQQAFLNRLSALDVPAADSGEVSRRMSTAVDARRQAVRVRGDPAHHLHAGRGRVRAVHASTEGVPVRIADIDSIGPISTIRRVVG